MIADFEESHLRLFDAWQIAGRITTAFQEAFISAREHASAISNRYPKDVPKQPVMASG